MRPETYLTRLLIVAFLLAGCGATSRTHPELIVDESVCGHCRMLISDARHAAGTVGADGAEVVYDDIACLLESKPGPDETIWFHSFDADVWIPSSEVAFVTQERVRAPMGGQILAFASRDAAEKAKRELGGDVIATWDALQSSEGDSK